MPPLNSRATRDLVKRRRVIPGPRSLHRGIHFHENETFVAAYKKNSGARRQDHRDLLVHHQKINEELQDVYARTAALHAENATMEERIEESWRQFERIGGKRPANAVPALSRGSNKTDGAPPRTSDHLRNNKTGVGFADRLRQVAQEKKELRDRSQWERETRGEAVDYSQGSALHAAKDKRIALFQRRQLKREHLLRRIGDPTPLKQSGRYDINSGTLRVFNKTIRRVQRDVRHDERTQQVKERRKGARSMWDARGGDENPNRPSQGILRYTREFELGPRQRGKKGRRGK
ncbi:hypothetical protein MOQ_005535 [Trypanosoma cruzi marinkellei]|uniref:Uncharacterized protein n=1 Tax=Trypanosoma cruzi marinkellei TaxID=85056 RepID=K2MUD5_TRYCR|nr:hypothetical protein MOQ_005535 [Trypanosoma cruzi marinkellei]